MHTGLLIAFLLSVVQTPPAIPLQGSSQSAQAGPGSGADPEIAGKLLKVKRIYVDGFGDDNVAKQLQAMVVNALAESKRFVVTENKDKADAVLRGSALEKTAQELHAIGEGTAAAVAAGAHSGSVSGSSEGFSGSHSGGFGAKALAAQDSQASTETINDARLAVRLVVPDGDVVWTTTQESKGAKYKGASADVADKVVKQLLRDLERLEKSRNQSPGTEKGSR